VFWFGFILNPTSLLNYSFRSSKFGKKYLHVLCSEQKYLKNFNKLRRKKTQNLSFLVPSSEEKKVIVQS